MRVVVGTLTLTVILSVSCDQCDPAPVLPERSFVTAATHADAALMSVGGTGPNDVWLVGAQPAANAAPLVLHGDGTTWTPVATGQVHDI